MFDERCNASRNVRTWPLYVRTWWPPTGQAGLVVLGSALGILSFRVAGDRDADGRTWPQPTGLAFGLGMCSEQFGERHGPAAGLSYGAAFGGEQEWVDGKALVRAEGCHLFGPPGPAQIPVEASQDAAEHHARTGRTAPSGVQAKVSGPQ